MTMTYEHRQLDGDRTLLTFRVRSIDADRIEVTYHPSDVQDDELTYPMRAIEEDFGAYRAMASRTVDRFDGEVTEIWFVESVRHPWQSP